MISRNLGQTAGIPLMGAIFTSIAMSSAQIPIMTNVTDAPKQALVNGLTGAYRVAAMIILLSTILAVATLWIERKRGLAQGNL